MYHFSVKVYEELAAQLRQELAGKSYYSGSVTIVDSDVECRLTATLIIYRSKEQNPDGDIAPIVDVVPVWWECHTTIGIEEQMNDCDFALIRHSLLDL